MRCANRTAPQERICYCAARLGHSAFPVVGLQNGKMELEDMMNLKRRTGGISFAVISALAMTVSLAAAQDQAIVSDVNGQRRNHPRRVANARYPAQLSNRRRDPYSFGPVHVQPGRHHVGIRYRSRFSPALRSPGHGVWQREHGWQDYSFAFTYYRYNASGVFLGSQRVRATLELGASGDEFASRSVIEILDVNDNVIGTGCATAVGTRFE